MEWTAVLGGAAMGCPPGRSLSDVVGRRDVYTLLSPVSRPDLVFLSCVTFFSLFPCSPNTPPHSLKCISRLDALLAPLAGVVGGQVGIY
jgi:hypothetical protein